MDDKFPSLKTLEEWFSGLADEQAHLLPAARWLVLGPLLFRTLHRTPGPTGEQLIEVLRFLRRRAPSKTPVLEGLAAESREGRSALLEVAVDKLLETEDWTHPNQVLSQPRPDHQKLLSTCKARLRQARERGDDSAVRLADVAFKVHRAARLSEEARRNRERWHGAS